MSVWESFEVLKDFVFSPAHVEVLRKRKNRFFTIGKVTTALWDGSSQFYEDVIMFFGMEKLTDKRRVAL